jgi:tryptophanyl-tRNA synthetase
MNDKKVVFSGIQPTGKLHIGNYLGAIDLWKENQSQNRNIFCIVDMHAITVPEAITPKALKEKTREVAAIYLASGIDPRQSDIFIQSQIKEHAQLSWYLNCVTPLGWLGKMTQFKDKSQKGESVGAGLLNYPVLMASDILLYQTDIVPVGKDQQQHLELTRNIAQRFNSLYGETFKIPEALIRSKGAKIMGLDDPTKKMSKSIGEVNPNHSIGILDEPQIIRKSIMRAVTDSGNDTSIYTCGEGVKNLLTIYQAITKLPDDSVDKHFVGKGYGFLKKEVADTVITLLSPIQQEYKKIIDDKSYIDNILLNSANNIRPIAAKTIDKVEKGMGIGGGLRKPAQSDHSQTQGKDTSR